jgi:D-alanyl-D-alanine carboxypeptidase/D-alanyl-D-alanine-endopeptidase (penicillin-binding protein 4)
MHAWLFLLLLSQAAPAWEELAPGPLPAEDVVVAAWVADAATGEVLLAHDEQRPMNPASVSKLATAWWALERLGPDHRFRTDLHLDREGRLYVRGGADPFLTYRDLLGAAARLKARGVSSLREVVLDLARFGPGTTPPAFEAKGTDQSFRPEVAALAIEFGAVEVRVKPGAAEGAPVQVSLYPPGKGVKLDNRAVTSAEGKPGLRVRARGDQGVTLVEVSGNVRPGGKARTLRRRVWDPAAVAGASLVEALRTQGIAVRGKVRSGHIPPGTPRVVRHRSPSLAALLGEMNRWSNNFMAEALLRDLDPRPEGRTFEGGAEGLARALREATGADPSEVTVRNGSGLYDANRWSARVAGGLLLRALQGPWAPEWLACLALAGHEGTLEKRLSGLSFRGKTGTLDQVIALAGYLEGPPSQGATPRRLALVVFLQGSLKGKEDAARAWIDGLVRRLAERLSPPPVSPPAE